MESKSALPTRFVHPAWHILVREGLSSGCGGFVGLGASAASHCGPPILLLHLHGSHKPNKEIGAHVILLHWFNHCFYLCL